MKTDTAVSVFFCDFLRISGTTSITDSDNTKNISKALPFYCCGSCQCALISRDKDTKPEKRGAPMTEHLLRIMSKRAAEGKVQLLDVLSHIDVSSAHNPSTSSRTVSSSAESCAVCDEEFCSSNFFVELPCRHRFHKNCVRPWFEKSRSCPLCRTDLPLVEKPPTVDELVSAYTEVELQKKLGILIFYTATDEVAEDIAGLHCVCAYDPAMTMCSDYSESVCIHETTGLKDLVLKDLVDGNVIELDEEPTPPPTPSSSSSPPPPPPPPLPPSHNPEMKQKFELAKKINFMVSGRQYRIKKRLKASSKKGTEVPPPTIIGTPAAVTYDVEKRSCVISLELVEYCISCR